jgi:acetyltransferase-like isoleucine patch superfamily enzyme
MISFKIKYVVFLLKNLIYKVKFKKNISLNFFKVGMERGCLLIVKNGGCVDFGRVNYFTRYTNIETYGGQIKFGDNVSFNRNCNIVSRSKIKIGDNCMFGPLVSIYDHNHGTHLNTTPFSKQNYKSKEISIGNNVWIGAGVVVLPGSSIGDNVIVGANAVVLGSLDSNSIYMGIPAKKVNNAK